MRRSSGSSTSSAAASRTRSRRPASRAGRLLRPEPLSLQDDRLQGHAQRRQLPLFYPDLQRPAVETARWRWSTRASAPTPSPTWARRTRTATSAHNGEINTLRGNVNWMTRARASSARRCSATTSRRSSPSSTTDGQRLGDVRQRAGAARPAGRIAAARDDDDDPRSRGNPRVDERREEGVLRVPLLPHGAVGRPGVDRLHRRHPHRRGARPQRPAALALLRDQGRPGDHGVRGRRARHRAPRAVLPRRAACSRAGCSWSTSSRAASSTTTS